MIFIAFDIRRILSPPKEELPTCGLRMVEAKSLDEAKAFMRKFYPGHWAIIPKKVYDQGVINSPLPAMTASRLLEVLDTNRPPH
jgi:hypothetical protein